MNVVVAILTADLRSTRNSVTNSDRRMVFVVVAGLLSLPLLALAFALGAAIGVEAAPREASAVLARLFVAGAALTFVLRPPPAIPAFFPQPRPPLLGAAPPPPATLLLAR